MEKVTRTCTLCGAEKPLTDYYEQRRSKGGRLSRCKPCVIRVSNKYRAKRKAEGRLRPRQRTPEQLAYEAAWRESNREKTLAAQRKSKYGLTDEQYRSMLAEQDGRCLICLIDMDRPHVDHCHSTGRVRGLLCGHCNKAIGLLRDDPDAALRAAEYLRPTKAGASTCRPRISESP